MSGALALVPEKDKPRRAAPRQPKGDVVLTRLQVVEACGFVHPNTIKKLLALPGFPQPFYAFSRSPRWMKSQVLAWLKKQARAAQTREIEMERT